MINLGRLTADWEMKNCLEMANLVQFCHVSLPILSQNSAPVSEVPDNLFNRRKRKASR
jgi:hypothetical protein